jgi:hypothetical protein
MNKPFTSCLVFNRRWFECYKNRSVASCLRQFAQELIVIVRGPPHENRDHNLRKDRHRPLGEELCKVLLDRRNCYKVLRGKLSAYSLICGPPRRVRYSTRALFTYYLWCTMNAVSKSNCVTMVGLVDEDLKSLCKEEVLA